MAKWNVSIFQPSELSDGHSRFDYDNASLAFKANGSIRVITESNGTVHLSSCRFHATKIQQPAQQAKEQQ